MAVRAKFYVYEVAKTTSGSRVTLHAVCRGEDNKVWASATPVGKIEMTILNDVATEQFEVGGEMFVDFTPIAKEKVGQPGME